MKPLKKLYREIVSLENLYRAAHATLARGRRSYGEGASFSFHLEREVSRLHRDLAAGAYRHGRYQIFQIRDPKPRTIAAAGFRDRVLHHAVHDVVEPGLDPMFIFEGYACRKGKGAHRAFDRIHHFPARPRVFRPPRCAALLPDSRRRLEQRFDEPSGFGSQQRGQHECESEQQQRVSCGSVGSVRGHSTVE